MYIGIKTFKFNRFRLFGITWHYSLRNFHFSTVDDPCTMGCQGLSFCTNFNNRPTSLFRNCNVDDDEMARFHFK